MSLFQRPSGLPHRDALVDSAFLLGLRLLSWRRRYFRDGFESPPFTAHLSSIRADWPPLGNVGTHELTVETLAGSLDAAVSICAWHGPDAPTLVWHHGGGEYPPDTILSGVYPDPTMADANLILVRAPGHDSRFGVQRVGATMRTYLATLAVAVAATDHVVEAARGRTVVAGYSLGGFVTNRHHVHRDTADVYLPLMAGTAHGEIFCTTVPAAAGTTTAVNTIRERLNFTEAWRSRPHAHVHPVLGRYDRLNLLATQRASYPGVDPTVWPVGHLRGIGAHDRIRRHIGRHLHA